MVGASITATCDDKTPVNGDEAGYEKRNRLQKERLRNDGSVGSSTCTDAHSCQREGYHAARKHIITIRRAGGRKHRKERKGCSGTPGCK